MRASGILLPVFSLPGKYGIGTLSKEAYDFVDWLKKAGQGYWQILPLGPTGSTGSPYQSYSTFAGDPNLISLDALCEDGFLNPSERKAYEMPANNEYINYRDLTLRKWSALRLAFARFKSTDEFEKYCEENADWLDDYALFKTIKDSTGGLPWYEWERPLKFRHKSAIEKIRKEREGDIQFYKFVEYSFSRQWKKLKEYANKNGIKIIGDLPIYVALDSADAWSSPKLFKYDKDLAPKVVAGCPPDCFTPDGQLWGNPVYDWKYHEKTDFEWWMKRFKHCFEIYDMLRIDHFRGFASYYEVENGAPNAIDGKWVKGPGIKIFDKMKKEFGDVPVIAEDLGFLTEDVFELLEETGYPGMKILEFAFDSSHDSLYLPHKYNRNCVVYTGTHDNDTVVGWLESVGWEERKFICDYVGHYNIANEYLAFEIVRLAMGSIADLCIVPIQDYLSLGRWARTNTPGTVENNWRWRVSKEAMTEDLAAKIEWLTDLFGRKMKVTDKEEDTEENKDKKTSVLAD